MGVNEQAQISSVQPGSIAEELEIQTGDRIISINEQPVRDLIDYRFLTADEYLELRILKSNGEEWLFEIEKDYDEDLGVNFEKAVFGPMRTCANECLFCFVDQMPKGVRDTLYVKDDDYRLSFLQGNFVTLTNLTKKDLERIARLRLSPLYVSVHCTSPQLRVKLLNNKRAGNILEQLKFFREHGITLHTQVVLCPGLNDGVELERTLSDLIEFWPTVQSIAIVPVGLTRHRDNLQQLRTITSAEAHELITRIKKLQEELRSRFNKTLVYLSDEFYLVADEPIPPTDQYDEYEQIENGVGLVRLLYDRFEELKQELPRELLPPRDIILVTGILGEKAIEPIVEELKKVKGLFIKTLPVENRFFGKDVTVTGLLTGSDVLAAFEDQKIEGDLVIIPAVMCKKDEGIFLDGTTPDYLQEKLGIPVRVVDVSEGMWDLYKTLF